MVGGTTENTDAGKDTTIRDTEPYSSRNSSKGALIQEAGQLFQAIDAGMSIPEVREEALTGKLFRQKSHATRTRIWRLLHYRYLSHRKQWIIDALAEASSQGARSQQFRSIAYYHYAIRDRLTYDFVTHVLWNMREEGQENVSKELLLDFLDQAAESQTQVGEWSESTRRRLSSSILAALRDFGLLSGVRNKTLAHPQFPVDTAEHIMRFICGEEDARGRQALQHRDWRLFLCPESHVKNHLARLAQQGIISFESVGSTVVLDTPEEWREQE